MQDIVTPKILSKTSGYLSVIQMFSTLSYAVLYSTLILYTTQKLKLTEPAATAIIGTFGAFNFALHILGGYFGGRFLSWRVLFFIGMILQVIGCICLSVPTIDYLYLGLAFFLTGSGLNVTCINMMLTQLFEPLDKRREHAFLWNYAFMNVGFFIGFSMAGHFQLKQDFRTLFLLASLGNCIAMLITSISWKNLKDRNTVLSITGKNEYLQRVFFGLFLVAIMIPCLRWLVEHATFSNRLIIFVGILMLFVILTFTFRQKDKTIRAKMLAYIFFSFAGIVFWTLYQLAPMALTLFAQYNVNRHYLGFLIAPQWIQNVNTFVIAIGGPLLSIILKKLHKHKIAFHLPLKFSLALLLVGCGLVILPIGIIHAAANGLINLNWVFVSYALQSVGELFIGPMGYAMVGQLVPQKLQGIMMGTWMMSSGVAYVLANHASVYAIANTTSTNPLITNPGYAHMFNLLGWTSVVAGVILLLCMPWLKKLTQETKKYT